MNFYILEAALIKKICSAYEKAKKQHSEFRDAIRQVAENFNVSTSVVIYAIGL